MNAINRQKFLAELAKLLTFMYEEDRRYALDMYERMFDIAEGNEQWLIQNLMSPTRQAVIIARSYDAKERKLSVSAEWREDEDEVRSGETPPFVLAINKIFDDLFPEEEDPEETDVVRGSSSDLGEAGKKETKRPKMPKAAVLLDRTQEFESIAASAAEEMIGENSPEETDPEEYQTEGTGWDAENNVETEPDPRVQIVDRAEFYDSPDGADAEPDGKPDDTAPGLETALPGETEAPEQGSITKTDAEADFETRQTEAPKAEEQPKKRRSIEELLGFRKEKRHSEHPEQSTAAPMKEAEEAAEVQPASTERTEKAEGQPTETDTLPKASPEQGKQTEAPARASVKVVPLDPAVNLPEKEDTTVKASPVKPAEAYASEAEVTGKKSEEASESEPVSYHPLTPGTEPKEQEKPVLELPEEEPLIRKPERSKKEEEEALPVKRVPNVPVMILFFIVAIPSVPVMLALLAVFVALFVSLSFGMIALGSILVISAFSGFAVLADILLLLGAAIIALALGLLFLWLAIWVIAEGMAGLIRSVGELYREWCYKEVPAE